MLFVTLARTPKAFGLCWTVFMELVKTPTRHSIDLDAVPIIYLGAFRSRHLGKTPPFLDPRWHPPSARLARYIS